MEPLRRWQGVWTVLTVLTVLTLLTGLTGLTADRVDQRAAGEPPRLFRPPAPKLHPLQKSTIITRQSSIRRTISLCELCAFARDSGSPAR